MKTQLIRLHTTIRDRYDIAVSCTVLGDCLWFFNDKVLGSLIGIEPLVTLDVLTCGLLFIGFFVSMNVLGHLIVMHDRKYNENKARKARENAYVPQSRQSEK